MSRTPAALQRWSCSAKQLPPVEKIRRIHIYDFDNTLFQSPLPNKALWESGLLGRLQGQDTLHGGGWWHNPRILAATGEGLEKEEPRAWAGSWNEHIVDLARLSAADDEALNVLLTGRGQTNFTELLTRMTKAKGLDFDILALKIPASPDGRRFDNTLEYKKALIEEMVRTYPYATEVRMYEDRPKHTKAFREFFMELNAKLRYDQANGSARGQVDAEVVQVSEAESFMDPVSEVAEVQTMINNHNQAILDGTAPFGSVPYKLTRNRIFTAYMISSMDTTRLKQLIDCWSTVRLTDLTMSGNNIMISMRPPPDSVMKSIGGMGAHVRWRTTGLGQHENRIFAVRVEPVGAVKTHTEFRTPFVVLGTKRLSKASEASKISHWTPIPPGREIEFDSTVGERVVIRMDREYEDKYVLDDTRNQKRSRDEEFPALGAHTSRPSGPRSQQNGAWSGNRNQRNNQRGRGQGGRGNRRGAQGGRGGGGNRGRGAYRSLDATYPQNYGAGSMEY